MKLSVQDSTLARLQSTLRETEEQVCSLKDTVAQQRDDLHAGEMDRRRLNNTIQELKVNGSTWPHGERPSPPPRASIFIYFILYLQGNIRVFCRVRPLVEGGLSKHIQLPASDIKLITLAKTEEVGNF